MTIVTACYDTDKPISSKRFDWFPDGNPALTAVEDAQVLSEEQHLYREALVTPTTAHVFSDSLLSRDLGTNRMPVAETAEKIFEIPIVISVPLFDPSGAPSGRYDERYRYSCGVAYAGSFQMCHMVIEKFRREMLNLRYTWISDGFLQPGRYAICRSGALEDVGQPRPGNITYKYDIDFSSNDLPSLKAQLIAEVFTECFDFAMQDHFPKEDEIAGHKRELDIQIDFVLLVYCLEQKRPAIHNFGWEIDDGVFPKGFRVTRKLCGAEKLIVLGHVSWIEELRSERERALSEGRTVFNGIVGALRSLIAKQRDANFVGGAVQIGRLDRLGFTKK